MNQAKIIAFIVLLSVCGFCSGNAAEQPKLTPDQVTILRQEFENIALKIQLAQQRQREIATILAPYVARANTGGVKGPDKKKGVKK